MHAPVKKEKGPVTPTGVITVTSAHFSQNPPSNNESEVHSEVLNDNDNPTQLSK